MDLLMNTVVHVVVLMLLASTSQWLCKFHNIIPLTVFLIDSSVQNEDEKQIKFPIQAEQGKLFHWSIFHRRLVALSGEIVPLDEFSQTRCLGMFLHLTTFIRQSVTIKGELVPLENNFADKLFNPFR